MPPGLLSLPEPLWENSHAPWLRYSELVGAPKQDAPVPDFLTICPSRTGTTWIAHHLGRHPGIFVPPEKELRYFDARWRTESIDRYQEHFRDAGTRLKGESTPSYALLPATAIRAIHRMNPQLKLIFLARRLPERAWSHTRHGCRHFEGSFRNRTVPLSELSASDLAVDFLSDYALSSADYCGTLRRWLDFFPAKQIHVQYFEEAVQRPEAYFQDLLQFLGAEGQLPAGDLHVRVNEGSHAAPPDWAGPFLEDLFAQRHTQIEDFLDCTFGLKRTWRPIAPGRSACLWLEDTRGGWRVSLRGGVFEGVRLPNGDPVRNFFLYDLRRLMAGGSAEPSDSGLSTVEEQRLDVVLQELGEDLATAAVVHLGVLQGFNIVQWKRLFYGIRQSLGPVDVTAEEGELHRRFSPNDLILAPSRGEVEVRIRAIEESGVPKFDSRIGPATPVLVGSHRGFNLVRYNERVYGLRQSLGAVDLTAVANPHGRFAVEDFLVDDSLELVLARIEGLEGRHQNL